MQDRVPLYPGRVTLTPVSGQANTFDLVRADQPTQEGTPLNKASLLKDTTAALFGLGADAVPDDVLHLLSRFQSGLGNEYVWRKYTKSISYGNNLTTSKINIMYGKSSKAQYSTNAKIEGESVVMVDPIEITFNEIVASPSILKGKYYISLTDTGSSPTLQNNTLYFIPSTANVSRYDADFIQTNDIRVPIISDNLTGYVNSPSPDAYPPAVSDGDTYTLLGQLGDKVRIATGSYTGTGTHGSSNPNSLTFEFEPKVLFIAPVTNYSGALNYQSIFWKGVTSFPTYIGSADTGMSVVVNWGKTVSWYTTGSYANRQLNDNGVDYAYVAIG